MGILGKNSNISQVNSKLGNTVFGQSEYNYIPDNIKIGNQAGNPALIDPIKLRGLGDNAFGKYLDSIATSRKKNGWFGKGGYLDGISGAIQAGSALLQGWNGMQDLKLAKQKFAYEKGLGNRNIFNQGTLVNNAMDNANAVGLQLAGNTMTAAQKASSRADTLGRHVKTSKIG